MYNNKNQMQSGEATGGGVTKPLKVTKFKLRRVYSLIILLLLIFFK